MSLNNTLIEPGSYTSDDELTTAEERARLKAVLEEVSVVHAGFLDVRELKTVCEHIGIENLSEEELSFLFEELDVNKDGKLSFDEFLNGLSKMKEFSASAANTPPRSLPGTPPQSLRLSASFKRSTSNNRSGYEVTSPTSRIRTPSSVNQNANLFTSLDPNHSGFVAAEAISELLSLQGLAHVQDIIQSLQNDTNNKISIRQLSETLEHIILEISQDPPVTQAILSVYKNEVGFLRSAIEQHKTEKERLKSDLARTTKEQTLSIRQSEERNVDQDRTYHNLKNSERDQRTTKQIPKMEYSNGQQKYEEQKLKDELANSEEEKNHLSAELASTHRRLVDAQRNVVRLTKELNSASELSLQLTKSNGQHQDFNKQQSTKKELQELKYENRELRDQVQKLTTRCNKYQDEIAQLIELVS
ncbi:Ninein-like protein [Trichoplax sp. H2]|uniref:EF-hand domain-containing protein n=1 Tax=Trichoplax adhaerens TaxID=10228 RepID=B3RMN8_TRIAD|nr:hypothetical protein TRIADDRAFT_52869 [Trichoplax adhaerens]EDV27306.1 hypothetical protein TRIADDRAFT_52869 [Trichoplax adhaerens]RDD43967.1 Ninein-like protein [Trichoplax sp. H2]|eukprot:XP_002109140.1 hypothetical protein TRIADDRAFT_52869 [Trichoplax adhaerens]